MRKLKAFRFNYYEITVSSEPKSLQVDINLVFAGPDESMRFTTSFAMERHYKHLMASFLKNVQSRVERFREIYPGRTGLVVYEEKSEAIQYVIFDETNQVANIHNQAEHWLFAAKREALAF